MEEKINKIGIISANVNIVKAVLDVEPEEDKGKGLDEFSKEELEAAGVTQEQLDELKATLNGIKSGGSGFSDKIKSKTTGKNNPKSQVAAKETQIDKSKQQG